MTAPSTIKSLLRPEILSLKPYSSARSLACEGLFLDANENPATLYPGKAWAGINRYPMPQPQGLVDTAAKIYGVSRGGILATRGSDEGIELLVRAFCSQGKDRILICPPTYGVYETAAAIQGCAVVRIPSPPPKFTLNIKAVLKAVTDSRRHPIKLVFICTPNNPTGAVYAKSELMRLARALRGKALLVVDEAYQEFSGLASLVSEIPATPNLAVLRTLSKAWGLAGLRLGFTLGSTELISFLRRIQAPYPLSQASVRLALSVFNPKGQRRMRLSAAGIFAQRKSLATELSKIHGVETIFESHANFLLVREADKDRLLKIARSRGIILRDRSGEPGLGGCVRVSIGRPADTKRTIRCFKEALE